jgi:hypothetical protein
MAILVPRWLDSSWQVRLQMCLKCCMVKIVNRIRAQTHSTISRALKAPEAAKARILVNHTGGGEHSYILHLGSGGSWW